eukprot:TRINITY_DN11059_c4_g1_i1.p1 TRINITY_DN11059_c4_g1~~TRINITY_DN11059_c4_g1_i1.p1  ORF type:complete len:447 (-),score=78.76 TRINITY_DN11059_c4_g1_i1:147-1319(-)
MTGSKLPGYFCKMMLKGSEKRLKEFSCSSDIAMALLASSTCGISGLPFTMKDEDGKSKQVADGGFKNMMPEIDRNSITVKPFCDGIDIFSLTGRRADIGPSEYVTGAMCFFPAPEPLLRHLYELGYQDAQQWLDSNLDERVADLKKTAESTDKENSKDTASLSDNMQNYAKQADERPEIDWGCANDGMLWYDELLTKVPVAWKDMVKGKKFYEKQEPPKILNEGDLELDSLHFYDKGKNGKPELKHKVEKAGISRWVTLTSQDIKWRESKDDKPEDRPTSADAAGENDQNLAWMVRGLKVAGAVGADQKTILQRAKRGRVHLTWIQDVELNSKIPTQVLIRTAHYSLTFKAPSKEDAFTWSQSIKNAVRSIETEFQSDGDFDQVTRDDME